LAYRGRARRYRSVWRNLSRTANVQPRGIPRWFATPSRSCNLIDDIRVRPSLPDTPSETAALRDFSPVFVCFSNRPTEVKRFQTIRRHGLDVARGLALLFGIGTTALPSWASKTRGSIQWAALPFAGRQVQADTRSHHIHRPARGHDSTARWNSSFLLSHLIPYSCHAATKSLVHRNSVPSTHIRCITTAIRRATATIARLIPRLLAIFMPQALSHDHLMVRVSMLCAASNSTVRIMASPPFEIPPIRSISPD